MPENPPEKKPKPYEPEVIRLTLKALPSPIPAIIRLRRALKYLLRSCGFRCERIEDMPGDEKQT